MASRASKARSGGSRQSAVGPRGGKIELSKNTKTPKPRIAKNIPPTKDWKSLLSSERAPEKITGSDRKRNIGSIIKDHRVPHEKDFDRVVFCAPVRRLKDKTQVFPLDMHDGVRTRLTHSLEVSNLARSMGVAVSDRMLDLANASGARRSVPALLAAIALTHDLGNPPFGHQGEEAIRCWVRANQVTIRSQSVEGPFDEKLFGDFLTFEGNAQGFRILTRLQYQDHTSGLRLTASTLRAFMKYPWGSDHSIKGKRVKKFGYFQSEKNIFDWCTRETGCGLHRHPLSFLMEVCDDIAYSVLDVEDAVKKGMLSVAEIASFLGSFEKYSADPRVEALLTQHSQDKEWLAKIAVSVRSDEIVPLSSKETTDSLVDMLRSYAIGLMVNDAIESFVEHYEAGTLHTLDKGIASVFSSSTLMRGFKDLAGLRIYNHPEVIRAELEGHKVIPVLMTAFWNAICAHCRDDASKNDEYVLSLMSPNYIRVFWQSADLRLPLWYRQLQLVCDQVCGMTDSFAVRAFKDLKSLEIV